MVPRRRSSVSGTDPRRQRPARDAVGPNVAHRHLHLQGRRLREPLRIVNLRLPEVTFPDVLGRPRWRLIYGKQLNSVDDLKIDDLLILCFRQSSIKLQKG